MNATRAGFDDEKLGHGHAPDNARNGTDRLAVVRVASGARASMGVSIRIIDVANPRKK